MMKKNSVFLKNLENKEDWMLYFKPWKKSQIIKIKQIYYKPLLPYFKIIKKTNKCFSRQVVMTTL